VTAVLLVFFLFLLLGAFSPLSRAGSVFPPSWVLVWAMAMVMLVADLAGLYWFGMWRGLRAKSADHAGWQNMACILVLPWAVVTVASQVAPLAVLYGVRLHLDTLLFALWSGLGLAVDLGFGLWARHKLLTGFRVAAARRYEQRPGFWRRLFTGP